MLRKKVSSNFFIVILLAVLYLAALVVWPYIGFIILAIVIAYTTYPLYNYLLSKIKKKNLTAAIMVLLVFALLLLPSGFIITSLVKQGMNTLSSIDTTQVHVFTDFVSERFNLQTDPTFLIDTIVSRARDFLISQSLNLLSSIVDIIIGILIMFFVLFYFFRDGKNIYRAVVDTLPLQKNYKHVLFEEMQLVTNAVIYGQLVIALIQGIAGGLAFAIFGFQNAVFWGFVIAIVSFLPIVGTPIVFIPAGILQLVQHNYFSGLGIIIFGIVLVMNVDSIVKPLIISERSRLNAALILIGVIGGIKVFGFMGFIIGPLVLALLFALLQVFRQDFKPSAELTEARKSKDSMIIRLHQRPPDEHRVLWSENYEKPSPLKEKKSAKKKTIAEKTSRGK